MGFFVSRHLGLLLCNIAVMKRFLLLLIFGFLYSKQIQDISYNVAIINNKTLSTFTYNIYESALEKSLINTGKFTLVDRSIIESIISEKKLDFSGLTQRDYEIIESLTPVDYLLSISFIDVKMISVITGEIVKTVDIPRGFGPRKLKFKYIAEILAFNKSNALNELENIKKPVYIYCIQLIFWPFSLLTYL